MVNDGRVTTINGDEIEIKADSICVHGDDPMAVEFARGIRKRLESSGIEVSKLGKII